MAWKSLLAFAALVLSAGIIGAGDAKKDQEKLQGSWIVVSHMNNNRKFSDEDVKKMEVIIKAQTLTLRGKGKGEDEGKMEFQ